MEVPGGTKVCTMYQSERDTQYKKTKTCVSGTNFCVTLYGKWLASVLLTPHKDPRN